MDLLKIIKSLLSVISLSSRLLQSQLDQTEKENRKKEEEYLQEISELKRENQRQQKLIGQVRKARRVYLSVCECVWSGLKCL